MTYRIFKGMLLLTAAWLVLGNTASAEGVGPEVGKPAPNLIGRTLADDKLFRLSAEKNMPKVVNFFWVQCGPCKAELPELGKLEQAYPGVKFVAVHAVDEQPEVVQKFIGSLAGAPATVVLTTGSARDTFHYKEFPHTVVLDQNNVVLANLVGYTPANMRALKKLVAELSQK